MILFLNFPTKKTTGKPISQLKAELMADDGLTAVALNTVLRKERQGVLALKRETMGHNAFRPVAILTFSSNSDGGTKVGIVYKLQWHSYLFLIVGLLMCGLACLQAQSLVFVIPAILWLILWWILGMILFYYDLNKLRRVIHSHL